VTDSKRSSYIGRVLADRYELLDSLGEGGMGMVFRARQISMDREVAVKLLHPSLVEDETTMKRFEVEMRAMANMEHPNAAQVFDFGQTDEGEAFLVMELLKGKTLEDLMKEGPLSNDRIISIAHQVALALEEAHRKGMIHRDIKPANIMIVNAYGRSDWVKVLDFGLARFGSGGDTSRLTQQGAVLGTPHFMAPEQATEGSADARSDLYALGCVIFAMATGEAPFTGEEIMSILYKHVNDPRPKISERTQEERPKWLEDLTLWLMAQAPDDRPQTCHDAIKVIEGALGVSPLGGISQPSMPPAAKKGNGQSPWVGIALGLLVLAAGFGLSKLLETPPTDDPPDEQVVVKKVPKAADDAITPTKPEPKLPDFTRIREMGYEPLPEYAITSSKNPITPAKVALGKILFFDPRLSKDNSTSCNSCHDLKNFGVDGHARSKGVAMQSSERNSPTVINTAGQFVQGWDGRFDTVEEQVERPITHIKEMASSVDGVLAKLSAIPAYQRLFEEAFKDASPLISMQHIGLAIGAFERQLISPAPWDDFLAGDANAINQEAKKGFLVFEAKCSHCHEGAYIGGQQYQKVGLKKPWFNTKDLGRFDVTGKESDKMRFKVPGLRNVAKTGPYFHDGSVKSLKVAVQMMGEYQSTPLSDEETTHVLAWLDTLTGKLPDALASQPDLPQ
jgi:cytochrome c peroxidase